MGGFIAMNRVSWEQYFMAQAQITSLRSTCTRLMVGAIMTKANRIIASGYNGSVADSTHCIDEGCYMVDGHCVRTIHAEANAILQCARFGVPTEDTTLYVTHFPCLQCCKQIIQAGVKEVFYGEDYKNHDLAIQLFKEADVRLHKVDLTDIEIKDVRTVDE